MRKQEVFNRVKFIFILCLAHFYFLKGQNHPGLNQSKSNEPYLFFDKEGKKYNLYDLRIQKEFDSNGKFQNSIATTSCSSGYYNIYFETGSGMEGSSAIEVARRNVICQLFADLSVFINSPLTSTGNKVNIWVRDIANMGVSTPSINSTLGVGSQFFCIPNIQYLSGIADNMIYQTILSGKDAYTNVAAPLYTGTSNGGNYFHGAIAFNFQNSSFSWHTNLSLPTATNNYDLYSVALHEFTHALGFGSLIDQNGQSKFGATFPYYSRYDQFLRTQTNVPLIVNTTTLCSMYNYTFNPSLSIGVMQPGFTSSTSCTPDSTICSMAINYVGSITQPVYTPDCFVGGSTLSHFEDQCQVPASFTVTPSNNKYFVMCNAYNTGPLYMKRYLKPEERSVLCDLGYNVVTTFGSSSNLNNFNYSGSVCPGAQVAGINDGITSLGYYSFMGALNSGINLTGLLTNDFNAVSFECLEVISGNGTLSNSIGTVATYTPTSGGGAHLLRYIPVSASGARGNLTYVFVFAQTGTCTPSNCDLVNNGGFESGTSCGMFGYAALPLIDCWTPYTYTPDYFVRGCIPPMSGFTVPTTTAVSSPTIETWNYGPLNNTFVGLLMSYPYSEGLTCQLSTAIQPGTPYILSFWARSTNIVSNLNIPGYVLVAGSSGLPVFNNGPIYSLPAPLSELYQTVIPANIQWNYFSAVITNTTSTPLNYITVLNPPYLYSSISNFYILVDDISIKPINATGTLSIPAAICVSQTIPDLSLYTSTPGGVFSGSGVTYSTGVYSFSSSVIGNFNISYTYTNNLGCKTTLNQQITVGPIVTTTISKSKMCFGDTALVVAKGADSYLWNTGATTSSIIITPTVTTSYSVVGTSTLSGCSGSSVKTITVNPLPTIFTIPATLSSCAGQTIVVTAYGANSFTWSTGFVNFTLIETPTVSTTYSVVGINSLTGCTNSLSVTATVIPAPTLTLSSTSSTICSGKIATLTVGGANTYTWSPGIFGSSISVTPTVTTTYSVSGTSTVGCIGSTTETITVVPSPTINTTSSSNTVCVGGTITLTAAGANTYTWSTGANSTNISVNPIVATSYSVVGTNTVTGCTSSSVETITTIQPTITVLSSSSLFCVGETATLTATGANTYTWNTGPINDSIMISPSVTTTYSVSGTDTSGCTNITTFIQVVNSCIGINEVGSNNPNILIYPNPNNGSFIMDIGNRIENGEMILINSLGQKIFEQRIGEGRNNIQTNNLAKGLYHYILLQNKQQINKGRIEIE